MRELAGMDAKPAARGFPGTGGARTLKKRMSKYMGKGSKASQHSSEFDPEEDHGPRGASLRRRSNHHHHLSRRQGGGSLRRRSSGALSFLKNKLKTVNSTSSQEDKPSSTGSGGGPRRRPSQSAAKAGAAAKGFFTSGKFRGSGNGAEDQTASSEAVDRRIQRRKELREARFAAARDRERTLGTLASSGGGGSLRRKNSLVSVSSSSSRVSQHAGPNGAGGQYRRPSFHQAQHARGSRHARTLSAKSDKVEKDFDDSSDEEEEDEYLEQERAYLVKRSSMASQRLYYVLSDDDTDDSDIDL